MLSIKIGHDPRSRLTSLYLNKQLVDRLGGPGGRCTLTLLHPTQNGSILFFCNSLFGTKISAPRDRAFDGWWIWQATNALPESTPQFSGLMPKPVWSPDLKGFILNLDLMDWDLGILPTEETKSALRSALTTLAARSKARPPFRYRIFMGKNDFPGDFQATLFSQDAEARTGSGTDEKSR